MQHNSLCSYTSGRKPSRNRDTQFMDIQRKHTNCSGSSISTLLIWYSYIDLNGQNDTQTSAPSPPSAQGDSDRMYVANGCCFNRATWQTGSPFGLHLTTTVTTTVRLPFKATQWPHKTKGTFARFHTFEARKPAVASLQLRWAKIFWKTHQAP